MVASLVAVAGYAVYQQQTRDLSAETNITVATESIEFTPELQNQEDLVTREAGVGEPETVSKLVGATQETEIQTAEPTEIQTIVLAGGCFWCTEAYLQEAPGVLDAVSGYAAGSADDANYKAVSTGNTLHREAVRVTYDPTVISTKEVLDVYWTHIDPTDAGGQFADRGTQYTTAIYFQTDFQKEVAIRSKARLETSGVFTKPIVTLILPYTTFFPAEEYHQDYYKKAADYYERYKKGSGRAGFIDNNWAKEAALQFLSE